MSYARNKRAKERRRNRTDIIDIEKLQKQRNENLQKEKLENEERIKTLIKVEEEMGVTLVHGAMTYECEECGKSWRMWLEVGVEGKDKVMPCPFIIRCKCGGMAKHIDWQNDIWLPEPRPLRENMSYFKLDRKGLNKKDNHACGIPVLK